MAYRALLVLLLLLGGVFPTHHCSGNLLSAAVYVQHSTPESAGRSSPKNAERYLKYQRLKHWSSKMLKGLLFVSLAWTILYLYVISRDDRTASKVVAILLFGLMAVGGIILLLLFFAWLWWLLSSLWGWLFPKRLQKKFSKCYEW